MEDAEGQLQEENAVFKPVACEICGTQVAIVDEDEVYHFFHVIPS